MTESVCRGRCRVRSAETAFQRLNFHYNARMDGELLDLHYFAERRKGSTPLTTMTMSCSLNDFVSITSSSFGSPSIPNLSSRAQVIFATSVFFAFRSSRRREPGVTRSSGTLSCSAMIVLTSSQVTGRGRVACMTERSVDPEVGVPRLETHMHIAKSVTATEPNVVAPKTTDPLRVGF